MGVIYLRTNTINGMQYVGQTRNLVKREYDWKCTKSKYSSQLLIIDRDKFGIENFSLDILKECDDSELDKWEMYFIKEFDTIYPKGYNENDGGTSGFHHSEHTKHKISDSEKGRKFTEEHKTKISNALKGKPPTEAIKAHAEKSQKTTYQCKQDGTLVKIWNSMREAARELHYCYSGIKSCCDGGFYRKGKWINCNTYKDFKWMYKEDYEKMLGLIS